MIHVRCYKCGDEIEEDDNYGMAPDGNIACLECAVTLISEERDAALSQAKYWRESAARWKQMATERLRWMLFYAVLIWATIAIYIVNVVKR